VLNVPSTWKSFWTKPMELLGDVAHVESHFGPFSDGVSVGKTYHRVKNCFGCTRWYPEVTMLKWKLVSVC
jgi:hypothetical protein